MKRIFLFLLLALALLSNSRASALDIQYPGISQDIVYSDIMQDAAYSSFTIASTSPNIWFDANDYSTITESGGALTAIANKGSEGGSATGNATYSTGVLNGKPVIDGNGTSNRLAFANFGLTGEDDVSIFLVFKVNAGSTYDTPISFGANAEARFETDAALQLTAKDLGKETSYILSSVATSYVIFSFISDSSNWISYENGVQFATQPSEGAWSTGAGDYGLFATNTPGRWCNCSIAETIMWNRKLTDDEHSNVFTSLSSKWGVE